MHTPPLNRVAFVGTYVPRRCGLATFTHDLRAAVARLLPDADCPVVAMVDGPGLDEHPPEVRFACATDDASSGRRAAEYLNLLNADVVSLQHEYGIFGGPSGRQVLDLVHELRMPVHTTLHTVLPAPSPEHRRVMDELLGCSARVTVMTEHARGLLHTVHGIADDRIDVIPHGIPEADGGDAAVAKERFGIAGRKVMLTFGLLSPNKGIEHAIRSLPTIAARYPDVTYVIAGATHPRLLQDEGERYREILVALAESLGVADHVVFLNRYLDTGDLLAVIAAADIYLTPYLNPDQAVSGTLAYAFGSGTPVISTPYRHAEELLADGSGVLVPFGDDHAIAREVCGLLANDSHLARMRSRAHVAGRSMIWPRVAERYAAGFTASRMATLVPSAGEAVPPARRRPPEPILTHLWRLTDSAGVVQHATGDIPLRHEGYCTDDNARALALVVLVEDLGLATERSAAAAITYAAFLGHAYDPKSGRFRNFMDFSRRWREPNGSDDCLGRAIMAMATCIARARRESLRRFAMERFHPAVRAALATRSPRCWALTVVGLSEYLRRLRGDREAASSQRELTGRLLRLFLITSAPEWPWLEDVVAYENPRLCQALLLGGGSLPAARAAGLDALDWLWTIQESEGGRFAPIGCRGFLRRGGTPARFDQQPIEAQAMVAACATAYRTTGDDIWRQRAWLAFEWFHGHNVLGASIVDPHTGGCRDGLLEDRVSENQGAESTLAYLLAVVDMRQLEPAMTTTPAIIRPTRRPREARGACGR